MLLLRKWTLIISGGVLCTILFYGANVSGIALSSWVYSTVGILIFFASSFLVWQDERLACDLAAASLARTQDELADAKPVVSYLFEPKPPFLQSPCERPEYGDWAVAIGVKTSRRLDRASVRLLSVRVRSKDGQISHPLNSYVQPKLAWPAGERSFVTRDVDVEDYFVLLVSTDDGKKISIYHEPGPPELNALKELTPGTYVLDIVVSARNTSNLLQRIVLEWTGDVHDVEISFEGTP